MKLNITQLKRCLWTFAIFLMVFPQSNCKKEGRVIYNDANAPAPAQISDIKIVAAPGGAVVTYAIPTDPNFYYAKAVYEIQPNVFREAKSSLYNDTLVLEGFGDTLVHDVKIYSVGKNEKQSEPILSKIQPLTPPVQSVFKTINIVPTFGGIQVSFKNPSMAKIAIEIMKDTTSANTWTTLETLHTAADSGQFSIRGMDSINQKFAVFIRDRWNNKSDTLLKSLQPIFEEAIPKNTWKPIVLPSDQTELAGSEQYRMENLWDGKVEWNVQDQPYASANSSTLPQWISIDLGVKAVFSRLAYHQAGTGNGHFYNGSAPKVVEIWGSNDPDRDGSWASWDSLGTFHSFKPSGLPKGQQSDEDYQYAVIQGEDFEFDHLLPPYRYIRWKTIETYGSSGQVVMMELDLYGRVIK